ncbi:Receptor activity-modifying protein [Trichinella spiralis]|uniref:Receptor activity-modifying protein n=1 Tax=Trichinella spiralis TaxID=6334 RepID=A0ABR3L3B0_TRISP
MASSYVPLQEVRRSWFEYRIEIKKESYEHISQEQPVSHRRMAIFDCMPVELTVATELKSNKEGYFWPSPYSSQLFMKITICLCVNYTTKEVTVRKKCPRKKTIIFHSKFEMESFCMIFGCGSLPCRQLSSRASFTILPSPGQLLVMNSRTVVSSGNIRPIKAKTPGQKTQWEVGFEEKKLKSEEKWIYHLQKINSPPVVITTKFKNVHY